MPLPTVEVSLGTAAEAIEMAEDNVNTAMRFVEIGQRDQVIALLVAAVFVLVHQVNELAGPTRAERRQAN